MAVEQAMTPAITVIVPAYNASKTIEPCLSSIRRSLFCNFELIVVNDGSTDNTSEFAKQYADKVIAHPKNLGRSAARNSGIKAATGDILVFIDSDIVIQPDTLLKIDEYLRTHPDVDALTGLLSKEHPNPDFFSQYKNLYMNYIFSKLPDRVNFLFGSICAMRRCALAYYNRNLNIAEDSAAGQELIARGKTIAFLKDLDVIHLKKYNFISWVKNDFQVPRHWAKLFLWHQGWKRIFRNKTGYLHSPKRQLVSVALAPAILLSSIIIFFHAQVLLLPSILVFTWLFLNMSFFVFLLKHGNLLLGIASVPVTYLDHLVMALGIIYGLIQTVIQNRIHENRNGYFARRMKVVPNVE